jgi:FecR protein/SPOR domain
MRRQVEVVMIRRISLGLLLALAGVAAPSFGAAPKAVPNVVVEAVQMSAWVERDGSKIPLVPGMELKDRDQVGTGANSRILLKTVDGSWVKLGEKGSLALESLRMGQDHLFQAALKVAEGAFRFTTDALAKFRGRREVNITVANVTAGIRGTDLWGKSAPDRQTICLIEGKIEVTPPGDSPITLDQRLSYYVRDQGKSQPVAMVLPDQLKEWAAETETQLGQGVSKRGGKWQITVASGKSLNDALDASKALRDAGYAAEVLPAKVDNKRVYNVRVAHLATKKDAESVVAGLKQGPLAKYDYKVST